MSTKFNYTHSRYSKLLNRLITMQESVYYATAKPTLVEAEITILHLERRLQELIDPKQPSAFDTLPDDYETGDY